MSVRFAHPEVVELGAGDLVAHPQERGDAVLHVGRGLLALGAHLDAAHVTDTQELSLRRPQRHDHHVVEVAGPRGRPLLLEHAHHLERDVLDPDRLADRILVAEEFLGHGPADQGYLPVHEHVVVGEVGPRLDAPVHDVEVVRGGAGEGRMPVLVAVDHLGRAPDMGRDPDHSRHLREDGPGVRLGERLDPCAPHTAAAAGHRSGIDRHAVAAETLHLLGDPGLGALSDGHHGDHRADADDDAQHGQRGTKLVDPDGP